MIIAAILAGGKGTRFGSNIPKQYLDLAGQPIIIRTIDSFVSSNCVDVIFISVSDMWMEHIQKLIAEYYAGLDKPQFRFVEGGKERMTTLLNVTRAIVDEFGARSEDILLTHDAVRPFVSCEVIEDCVSKTRDFGVAMASLKSADTIYSMGKDGFLTSTYDRSKLYAAQTPQGCRMDVMKEVIESYTEEELLSMAGTSQLFINRGIDVCISLGDVDNVKITTMRDLDFANYRLQRMAGENSREY